MRAVRVGNKETRRGGLLLLCCSVANIMRMWGFNTPICLALSLSMFASLGEESMFIDRTFFLMLKFSCTCLVFLCEEKGNRSSQGNALVFFPKDTYVQMWRLARTQGEKKMALQQNY